MAKKRDNSDGPHIENRKARHDYTISDTLEVGMVLTGPEVKSVRGGEVSLAEGYVRVQEKPPALYLHGATIGEYAPAGGKTHRMDRTRLLLAHKREIHKLARQVDQKGMTVLPLKLYFKNGYAKLLIGVGKGRTKYDKRRAISERETRRDIDRATSRRA